jgi:AcrR family transcriptional regulator
MENGTTETDVTETEVTETEIPAEGLSTRHRILQEALSLMSQKGVDGTSMRDLASAVGLNVASLYHHFPSKRELLEAVLDERGFLPIQPAAPAPNTGQSDEDDLATMLRDILLAIFEVEDFVRLMVGEAMRGEETARATGLDLFATFESSIAEWVAINRPDLGKRSTPAAVAHLLSAMVVGIFVLQAAGVVRDDGEDLAAMITRRAHEAAQILGMSR